MVSDPHPDLLRSVKSDDFLPPIGIWTNISSVLLVATVGAAFTLASVIKYNVTVKAPANVRPTGEIRLVQASKEGAIRSILVKENQLVKQGEAIATIDSSQLQTQKNQLTGNIQNQERQLAQITAQLSALDNQVRAEESLTNRKIASATADLNLNQREYQDRKTITATQVQEAEAALELARVELKQYQQLANTGAIASLQIEEKKQAFIAAQAKLQQAEATLNPSAASITIAAQQISQDRARGRSTLATLNQERSELIGTQVEVQNQLNSDRQELKQVEIDLAKSIVKAPADGTIFKLDLRNSGQVVRPGELIAQIAPQASTLVVKARVAAQDIGQVQLCKQEQVSACQQGKVQLRVSAYPYPDYGTLQGAVRAIAPDAVTSQGNGIGVATPYYEVTIQPEKPNLVKGDFSYPIQPGMEGTADIISREETLLTFILRKARLLTDL